MTSGREACQLIWRSADAFAKRRLAAALALVACGAFLAAVTPLLLKLAVDSLAQHASAPAWYLTPVALIVFYVGGQYLWRCTSEIGVTIHGEADQRLRRVIGRRLFDHLIHMPMRFHLERKAGAMGETAEQGLRGYQMLLQHTVYTILPVTIELLAVTIVLMHAGHGKYLVILGVSAIAYVLAFRRWARAAGESAGGISSTHIDAHAFLTDALINIETVKYFDAATSMSQRYDTALGRSEGAWRYFFRTYAINGVTVATIFAVSLGATLVLAAHDVSRAAMTVGDFVLVNAYVVRLVQPLELLGVGLRDIAQGLGFLGRMLALLREQTEADVDDAALARPPTGAELVFANVSFGYRREQDVLKNVTFTVRAGQTVAVVGVSGSGKSSLIRLLFRLYEPDSGTILLDGTPIGEMHLSDVRGAIAVVPQDTVLFHDSIATNIGFGRLGASREEIEEAARLANLHDFIIGLPEQYETLVGERGLKLSGGERQRVAIARAALKRPRIVVFDEATSSLDTRTEKEIVGNLAALSTTCTTLVIAHRLSTVVNADEILVLSQGSIVERGTHQDLLSLEGQYAALWHSQPSATRGRDEPQPSTA